MPLIVIAVCPRPRASPGPVRAGARPLARPPEKALKEVAILRELLAPKGNTIHVEIAQAAADWEVICVFPSK